MLVAAGAGALLENCSARHPPEIGIAAAQAVVLVEGQRMHLYLEAAERRLAVWEFVVEQFA